MSCVTGGMSLSRCAVRTGLALGCILRVCLSGTVVVLLTVAGFLSVIIKIKYQASLPLETDTTIALSSRVPGLWLP